MSQVAELRQLNPLFGWLSEQDTRSLTSADEWYTCNSMKLFMADRLIRDTLPETRRVPPAIAHLFGHPHALSLARRAHGLLREHGATLTAVSPDITPSAADADVKLTPDEGLILGMLCYLHDIGILLEPSQTDERHRTTAADFVLSQSSALQLSAAEAAIVASLVTSATVADVDEVGDWREEGIRCRLIAATLVFANAMDCGVKRWADRPFRRGSVKELPDWVLFPHICVQGVQICVQHDAMSQRPEWRLRVRWWAPPSRMAATESWVSDYFRRIFSTDTESCLGRRVVELEYVEKPAMRTAVEAAFPERPVEPSPVRRQPHQERLVTLHRLLIVGSTTRAPGALWRAAAQWLIVNFVSVEEFRDQLSGPGSGLLEARLGAGPKWDWEHVRAAIVRSASLTEIFHTATVVLALSPMRYRDTQQDEFGRQAARRVAQLAKTGDVRLAHDLSDHLFSSWCQGGHEWRELAAAAVVGRPTVFGSDVCEPLLPRLGELLESADPNELIDLIPLLRSALRRHESCCDLALRASGRLSSAVPDTGGESRRVDYVVTMIGLLDLASRRGDQPGDVSAWQVEYLRRACALIASMSSLSQAAEATVRVGAQWGSLPAAPWLDLEAAMLRRCKAGDEAVARRLVGILSAFVGTRKRPRGIVTAHKEGLREAMQNVEAALGQVRRSRVVDARDVAGCLAAIRALGGRV